MKANTTLKIGLIGNAVFSACTGASLILFGKTIADLIGVGGLVDLKILGFLLLFFAGHLTYAVRRKWIRVGEVYYLSALDGMWVLGSVVLLALGIAPFTPVGVVIVSAVAAMVGLFMTLQFLGARKLTTSPST